MQVALVRLPYNYVSSEEPTVLPLGLNDAFVSCAAAHLKSAGYRTDVLDFYLRPDLDASPLVESEYELVLVSRNYPSQQVQVRRFLSKLKMECDKSVVVAVFGCGAAATVESTLRNEYADVVVLGEEPSILQLAEVVDQGRGLDSVQGVARLSGGRVSIQRPILYQTDLDRSPDPLLYHAIPGPYASPSSTTGAALLTSRGCSANCSFCHVSYARKLDPRYRWRAMSPDAVVALLERTRQLGIRYFGFQDLDFFGPDPRRVQQIAELIIARGLDVRLQVYARADNVVRSKKHLAVLHKAGIQRITLGGESLTGSKLARLNKGYRPEIVKEALVTLRDLDFDVQLGFIPFTPDANLEGVETELKEIRVILSKRPHLFKESFAYVANFLQFYDTSDLKSRFLVAGSRVVAHGFEQVYLCLIRKQSDPSSGPIPWFTDERVALLGLICLLIAAEASSKTNEIAHQLATRVGELRSTPTTEGREWLAGVVSWELSVSTFLVDLALEICHRIPSQMPYSGHEADGKFRELLAYAFSRVGEFYTRHLPPELAALRTQGSVNRLIGMIVPDGSGVEP